MFSVISELLCWYERSAELYMQIMTPGKHTKERTKDLAFFFFPLLPLQLKKVLEDLISWQASFDFGLFSCLKRGHL